MNKRPKQSYGKPNSCLALDYNFVFPGHISLILDGTYPINLLAHFFGALHLAIVLTFSTLSIFPYWTALRYVQPCTSATAV